jgi:hypothetical protein
MPAARIDQLAPEDKELLQTLAVLGKEFTLDQLKLILTDRKSCSTKPILQGFKALSCHGCSWLWCMSISPPVASHRRSRHWTRACSLLRDTGRRDEARDMLRSNLRLV